MHRPLLRRLAAGLLIASTAPAWPQATVEQEAAPSERAGPRWEVGLGAGGGRVADYPGADQSHTRGLVAPVFVYRGPVLRVDPGGIRGRLFDSPDWLLEASATGAFNARSNDARRGMPALDWLFGVGPQLVYKGWQAGGGPSVHLKTRAVFSTNFRHVDQRGATFDPELRWRVRPIAGDPSDLTLFVQSTWATRQLMSYFYQVDPAFALPTRPAYDARAGYLGTDVGATWTRRHSPSLVWFASVRAMSLHGAANAASPLLRDRTNVNVGAGLMWTLWRSGAGGPP